MKKYIYSLIMVGMLGSCDSILSPDPQGQIALDQLFSNENGIITAVNGAYQPLQGIYKGELLRVADLGSDDGWIWRKEVEPDIFIIDKTHGGIQTIWADHYSGITRTNTILNRIESFDNFTSDALKNSLIGQAKFLRAFYYFNLVRLYGGVPLILSEIVSREDSEKPRASIQQVYEQINTDLTDAIQLLPADNTIKNGNQAGMANSHTAKALMVLVALELENWDSVITHSADLMGTGVLLSNYADNFNGSQENGKQVYFEVQYGGVAAATTTGLSNTNSPPDFGGLAAIMPTDDNLDGKGGSLSSGNGFMQVFEANDSRKATLVQNYGLTNFIDPSKPKGSLYFVNKYYNTSDPRGLSTWNYPLIRFAEIVLSRAEALNEVGYEADGEAFDLLNKTRVNAGLTALTAADLPDQAAFRDALRKERRIELAFEAKRYFDLNRWGILEPAVQIQMDYIGLTFPNHKVITHPITQKPYYLNPIPSIEFVNNANLGEQNSGY
ncbi:putative outer membrane starch-binding protein [Dyadobacter jejuensis]|uniref:Putative outer membrane starch-binding protein n=1 Tax=Dyadobacter jejuensis TaxID=1082580 RepID=A0A316AJU8_9BACT|nr:RagB/SusD family nutrient uptake outer membrane protein [Dyadobacter jejuensis]PWJ57881.1 putative outer membrane starch-binding protein [Dyadobacter jejuensis]